MSKGFEFLYHLRDPQNSAGVGFDSYVGVTDAPARRFAEHLRDCASGSHSSPRVREMYERANGKLQLHIVRTGTREEVLASEALLVTRPNTHANVQRGGGPLRGRSEEELIGLSGIGKHSSFDSTAQTGNRQTPSISTGEIVLIAGAAVVVAGGLYYLFRKVTDEGDMRRASDAGGPVSTLQPAIQSDMASESERSGERVESQASGLTKLQEHVLRTQASEIGISNADTIDLNELRARLNAYHHQRRPWYQVFWQDLTSVPPL